jgi:hypothetical protein
MKPHKRIHAMPPVYYALFVGYGNFHGIFSSAKAAAAYLVADRDWSVIDSDSGKLDGGVFLLGYILDQTPDPSDFYRLAQDNDCTRVLEYETKRLVREKREARELARARLAQFSHFALMLEREPGNVHAGSDLVGVFHTVGDATAYLCERVKLDAVEELAHFGFQLVGVQVNIGAVDSTCLTYPDNVCTADMAVALREWLEAQ